MSTAKTRLSSRIQLQRGEAPCRPPVPPRPAGAGKPCAAIGMVVVVRKVLFTWRFLDPGVIPEGAATTSKRRKRH